MQLKLPTKKEIDENVLRMIIQYGLGFASRVKNLEEKCIDDWEADKLYDKESFVIYNGYIWRAKVTNQSSTWDEKYWEQIGDKLDLIDKQTLASMINLSDEEIASLQNLISTEIRLDKCFSSSDTYNRILNAENECKKFTLEELAKKAGGVVYKIVADTTGVDSTEYLYLISNGSGGYNIYAYIDGSAVKISDTNISLDGYAKLTDLADYLKTVDADGKYATIISLSNHELDTDKHTSATEKASYALKSSITDTIDSTSTSNDIASAKGVYDGLNGKVDKSSIVTTLSSTNTDEQVPSAKSVYDRSIKIYNSFSQLGLTEGSETLVDIGKAMEEKSMGLFEIISTCNSSEYPYTYGSLVVFKANDNRVVFNFYPTSDTTLTGREYVASYHESKDLFLPWKQIQTESTNDVASTKIELDSTLFSGGSVYYEVRNSICYVSIEGLVPKATGTGILVYDNIPIPKRYICVNLSVGNNEKMPEYPICARILSGSSNLVIHSYDNTKALYGSFSYPVS